MKNEFNLERYLTNGVENIVKGAIKATLSNPQESVFMAQFAIASKAASRKRFEAENQGEHIPPFLIASITSSCNLHCAGCYSRANQACSDKSPVNQLSANEWKDIFLEAKDMGTGFILLAGGEPMMRRDVIEKAAEVPEILFPIFTNGTMLNDAYTNLLKKHRNLVPVLSIEGRESITDQRRGQGTYEKLMHAMADLQKNKVLFGASVTVTTENLAEVMSDEFLKKLEEKGCKVVFFIEFVPVTEEAKELAPKNKERTYMNKRLEEIRNEFERMVFLSFPGDEKSSGGCLAAGRGFFHINSHGGAEPCPFSPYSDINVRDKSLREVLQSRLFQNLRENDVLMEEHEGGCILFEKRGIVEEFLNRV